MEGIHQQLEDILAARDSPQAGRVVCVVGGAPARTAGVRLDGLSWRWRWRAGGRAGQVLRSVFACISAKA